LHHENARLLESRGTAFGHVLVELKAFAKAVVVLDHTGSATYADNVAKLLEAQLATTDWIAAHDAEARTQANDAIEALTSKKLSQAVLDRAWSNLTITNDPVASSVQTSADHAAEVGVSGKVDLHGIYDLTPLNDILRAHGLPRVSAAGLGTE